MREQKLEINPESVAGSWSAGLLGPDMGGLLRPLDMVEPNADRAPWDANLPHADTSIVRQIGLSPADGKALVFSSQMGPTLEQCEQISALFREAYGARYPNQRLMNATSIHEDIAAGKYLVFAVVSQEDGRIRAIGGLSPFTEMSDFFAQDGKVFEVGKLIVARADQGGGLCSKLLPIIIDYARQEGASSLVSFAFTSHDYSQRALAKQGFCPTGINIGEWPAIFGPEGRESAVVMHLALDPKVRSSREHYSHAEIESALQIAFGAMECERKQWPSRNASAVSAGDLSERADMSTQTVQFLLKGERDISGVLEATERYLSAGFHHVSLSLELQNPVAPEVIEKLASNGFRYASVLPLDSADILTLQRTNETGEGIVLSQQISKVLLKEITQ